MRVEPKGKMCQAGGRKVDLLRDLTHGVGVDSRGQRQGRVEKAQQRQQFRLDLFALLFNPGLDQQAETDLFAVQPVMPAGASDDHG